MHLLQDGFHSLFILLLFLRTLRSLVLICSYQIHFLYLNQETEEVPIFVIVQLVQKAVISCPIDIPNKTPCVNQTQQKLNNLLLTQHNEQTHNAKNCVSQPRIICCPDRKHSEIGSIRHTGTINVRARKE